MKILHLLSQIPGGTGSGVTIQALIREAAGRGHQNYLLAGIPAGYDPGLPSIDRESCSFVEFESEEMPFKVVGMSDVMPYPSTRFCDLTEGDLEEYRSCFLSTLEKAVGSFKPDLIHSHHLWILTSLARCAFPRIPLVATCHGSDLRQFHLCPHLRSSVLTGCSSLDRALVLSRAQQREVMDLFGLPPEKVVVVGIGYQEGLFYQGKPNTPPPVVLLYAGKLSRAKGVLWLLKALLPLAGLPWQLHIAGSGTGLERDEIVEEAGRWGERVIFHGALPQIELAKLMRASHVFVLPSLYEGFPLVLIEALMSGCRLITTALPAVNEIFSRGTLAHVLSIVPLPHMNGPDTPIETSLPLFIDNLTHALDETMERAMKAPPRFDSEVEGLVREFTWSGVFSRIEGIYQELVPTCDK